MNDALGPNQGPLDFSVARVIDPICDQFEAAWKDSAMAGPRPRIEDFVGAVVESQRRALLQELILLEVHYRRQEGDCPKGDDYRERFRELEPAWLAGALSSPSAPPERPALSAASAAREFDPAYSPGSTQAASPASASPDCRGPLAGAGTIPRRLGDYHILREVGRGGMGVVYEAIQESLGRHVALKLLPFSSLLGPTHLERFQREARSAAKLHHTNIVPVYAVGEHEGVHYYAMQYIEGRGLDRVLSEVKRMRKAQGAAVAGRHDLAVDLAASLVTGWFTHDPPKQPGPSREAATQPAPSPTSPPQEDATHLDGAGAVAADRTELSSRSEAEYFRGVAHIGVQVAEALEYAHRHGVLHRDIKPSNLLLDATGAVWITDFGLAKAEGGEDLTSPGEFVGTLRYMAPERFRGQSDPRGDVYSLGLTLYELLTLRPAFSDSDRARLITQTQNETPLRPRHIDGRIPRDLETVVLKAMAKEPGDRYATAEALAEDLRRVLADRPIRARRTPLWERTWRLCRRNPVLAGLSISVALLLLVVAIGSTTAALWLQAAERQQTEKLWQSLLAQARAGRLSRRVGQRFESLQAVADAADIARKLQMSEDRFGELRNEVIACLALPDLKVAREWEGWPAGTLTVEFDGALERYARLNQQGTVTIRRVADDEEIYRLSGMSGASWVHLSPDGRLLMVGAVDWMNLWKLARPEPSLIVKVQGHACYDFSPDSRQFAAGREDGTVDLYDSASGLAVGQLELGAEPRQLVFHPTQRQLAIAFHDRVQARDLTTGNKLAEFPLAADPWPHVGWHPDGKVLAAVGGDRIIYLWDVSTGRQTAKLEGCKHGGINFTFSHDGDLLAGTGWDGMLRLWDPHTGKQLFSTATDTCDLRFSPDDRFLAGDFLSEKLRMWQVDRGREYRTLVRVPTRHISSAVSPDGRLLAVGTEDRFGLWDVGSGKELRSISSLGPTTFVLFESADALLVSGMNGLWRWPVQAEAASARELRIGPPQAVSLPVSNYGLACSADGRVLVSPRGWGALVLHGGRPGRPVALAPQRDVRGTAVSPDGRCVAAASFGGSLEVKIWDAETGKLIKNLFAGVGQAVAFSPNGQWLATAGDGVRVWEVGSWRERRRFEAPIRTAMAFSPDGKVLAFETGLGVVRLVDPETGREWARLVDPDQERAGILTFTADGTQLLITTSDGPAVHAWDLRAVRGRLAAMGLDWKLPPYPPAADNEAPPRRVSVELGKTFEWLAGGDRGTIGLNSFLLALNPFNYEAYWQRGRAYGRQREPTKAIADYSMALALLLPGDPRRAQLLLRRAHNYRTLQDKARAVADLHQLVSMELGDFSGMHAELAMVCNDMAWQLVTGPEKNRDPARALPLAQKAVTLLPELSIHHLNTLGVVHYRLGEYRQAAEVLERSLRENGAASFYDLIFLAMSYARLGDAAKASEYYDRAAARIGEPHAMLGAGTKAEQDAFWAEARAVLGKDARP